MLRPCPECTKDVSDSAETCPHCGYRLVGREALVRCPACRADVIPIRRHDDSISRFCPFCERPLTNLTARKVLLAVVVIAFLGALAFLLRRLLGNG